MGDEKSNGTSSGTEQPGASTSGPTRETETTGAKAQGFAFSLATSGCLFMVGVLLTATGVGAIIGLPMIIAAFLAPFLGFTWIKGACPYCGSQVSTMGTQKGVTCPACKKRIVIRNKKFIRVD